MNTIDKQIQRNVQPNPDTSLQDSSQRQHSLDGSQFHNVIDEQVYAEQPPTPEEQRPRRVHHVPDPAEQGPHPDDPAISVGPP